MKQKCLFCLTINIKAPLNQLGSLYRYLVIDRFLACSTIQLCLITVLQRYKGFRRSINFGTVKNGYKKQWNLRERLRNEFKRGVGHGQKLMFVIFRDDLFSQSKYLPKPFNFRAKKE